MPTREDIAAAADNFTQMIAYLDRNLIFRFANRRYCEFVHKSKDELLGQPLSVIVREGDEERIHDVAMRALAGEQQRYEILNDDRWVQVDVIPLHREDTVIGFTIVASDITMVREAQLDSDRYRAVVQSSLDGMIVIDEKGVIQSINPAAERMFGYTLDEVLGRNVSILMPQHHAVQHDEYLRRYVEGGRPTVIGTAGVEAEAQRKDGSIFAVDLSVAEFHGASGRLFTGTVRDITERKSWQQSLEHSNAQLEAMVEDRTRELLLAHETLRQSQKMEAIGQLTGGIAHDFNNLLAGIIGSLDILQARIDSGKITSIEQTRKYTDGAMEAAKKAASLTQRMLAFARRQPLEPKTINPNDAVSSMEDMLSRPLGAAVAFEISAKATWAIKCDPNELENGILNLVINARDATPEGGHICVSTRDVDHAASLEHDIPAGEYVCITVSDTGMGMSPTILERAFDPFFTTKPIGQGTGLGLSMVYGFVNQSEGHVRIDSRVGEGTKVHIFLPRETGPLSRPADEGFGPVPVAADEGQVVLVVEDEPLVREVVRDALMTSGFTVIETENAFKALDIIRSTQRIDLMVSDVGLPGMNGRQLAEEARQHRPGLGVLFVTGYAQNVLRRDEMLRPGMQMITKPFDVKKLAEKVIEMVG